MTPKLKSKDPDIIGSAAAMRRAYARAKRVARSTGTPLIVERDGKIIRLDVSATATRRRKHSTKKRP